MKIALVGMGQMGQTVDALADEHGHEVVARFDIDKPFLDADSKSDLHGADVVVDFSLPEVMVGHFERYCDWDLTAVVGTTGWYDELEAVREWVAASEAGILYAPNFSVGVALLRRALQAVVPLLDQLPEYDPYVQEIHHTRKADSPSGTALMLADVLVAGLQRKDRVQTETQHSAIREEDLHVTSARVGGVVGKHDVGMDSPFDHITLTHEAKNRKGFAFGALKAAEWLRGKQGLFTLDDVMAEWLGERED